jgi:hypothetical protein
MYFWNKKGRNSKIVINVRIKGKYIPGRTGPRYQNRAKVSESTSQSSGKTRCVCWLGY